MLAKDPTEAYKGPACTRRGVIATTTMRRKVAQRSAALWRRCAWLAAALSVGALILPGIAAGELAPLAQYGASVGSGAGQLNDPLGVAIDAAGNLYVADSANNRVSQFTAAGGFARAWGFDVIPSGGVGFEVCTVGTSCKSAVSGGGPGQFSIITGIGADPGGNVYVTDSGNRRVSQFAPTGGFALAWGFGVIPGGAAGFEVCTASTGCGSGLPGGAAGQFNSPSGVAAAGAGAVYVAAGLNQRVDQFGAGPEFVRAWGVDVIPPDGGGFESCTLATTCQTGDFGSGAGQFNTTDGIAADSAGNVYVTDVGNNRVSQFTASGGFVRTWGFDVNPGGGGGFEVCTAVTGCQQGLAGSAAGQLDGTKGVAVDGAGNVYVAEQDNDRVSQFTSSGNFVRAFGFDVVPGGSNGFEVCTAATTCKAGVAGDGAGQLFNPSGLAVDCLGAVYVTDTGNNRIQRFGDTGTPLPPCTSGGGGGAPTPPPVPNDFSFGKTKKNKKKGTAQLTVVVPGAGQLGLAGTGKVKPATATAFGAGELTLTVKPTRRAKKKLREKGAANVLAEVTFTPNGGLPNTESAKLRLVMR